MIVDNKESKKRYEIYIDGFPKYADTLGGIWDELAKAAECEFKDIININTDRIEIYCLDEEKREYIYKLKVRDILP